MGNGLVERRRYPRAAIDYRGVLETTSGDKVNLRTRNISGSGIYFDADKSLTDFTEVSLTIALPPVGTAKALSFRCRGVIVRAEDSRGKKEWPFSAAVHFTEIDVGHREAVCTYVDAVLAEQRKARREDSQG
jgi:c-di-GMP-binding flagellar brake protein YcgR